MKRRSLLLAVPVVLLIGACSDKVDEAGDDPEDNTTVPEGDGTDGDAGQGTVVVRLEPTDAIFIEGFEVGLRFDDPDSGEELKRIVWSELVASLGEGADSYTTVLEQPVRAGTVRLGTDVNIGIGPGPEPPDLDAARLPCELDLDVPDGGTVTVEVSFDDSTQDCARIVE
jgi:hypothetical protein